MQTSLLVDISAGVKQLPGSSGSGGNKLLRADVGLKSRANRSNFVLFFIGYFIIVPFTLTPSHPLSPVMTVCSFPALSLILQQEAGKRCYSSVRTTVRSASLSPPSQSTCYWAVSCWVHQEPVRWFTQSLLKKNPKHLDLVHTDFF